MALWNWIVWICTLAMQFQPEINVIRNYENHTVWSRVVMRIPECVMGMHLLQLARWEPVDLGVCSSHSRNSRLRHTSIEVGLEGGPGYLSVHFCLTLRLGMQSLEKGNAVGDKIFMGWWNTSREKKLIPFCRTSSTAYGNLM